VLLEAGMKEEQSSKQTESTKEKFNLGQKEAEKEKKGASQMKEMNQGGTQKERS
jgi:hypothetical protein